jgi:hypothetical protein
MASALGLASLPLRGPPLIFKPTDTVRSDTKRAQSRGGRRATRYYCSPCVARRSSLSTYAGALRSQVGASSHVTKAQPGRSTTVTGPTSTAR